MPTKSTTKKVSKKEALTSCGTHLKPGYKYVKGGAVVKVTAKAATKKTTAKKKGLGVAAVTSGTCIRTNKDGSRSYYTGQGGSNPCPYGGVPAGSLNGVAPKRKTATKKKTAAKKPTAKKRVVKRK